MSNKMIIEVEQKIAKSAIHELVSQGFAISIFDGETTSIMESKNEKEIFNNMFTTDQDTLEVYRDGKYYGSVFFVYGNDGYDVISDYTVNLEDSLTETNALAESYAD